TEREAHAEVRAAHPGNECRRINRTCDYYRAGRPSPVSAGVDPAAVVRGGESPGRIIDPGPAPRLDPDPMSIVIGSPTGGNRRNPNRTVLTHRAPGAVLVEFVGADHVGGNILVGAGVIFAVIAHAAPIVEAVESRRAGHLILHGSGAGEGGLAAAILIGQGRPSGEGAWWSGFNFPSGPLPLASPSPRNTATEVVSALG